jgi:micrococcal nuclease
MLDRLDSTSAVSIAGTLIVLAIATLSARPSYPIVQQPSVSAQRQETTASINMPSIPQRQRIPVDILRVIDGDTVEVRAHIWLDQQVQARIRLRTIDAPELKAACPREAALAESARENLAAVLAGGKAWLGDVGRDKFGGRFLGSLFDSNGRDVSQLMLATGHVRLYDGRKRQGWC